MGSVAFIMGKTIEKHIANILQAFSDMPGATVCHSFIIYRVAHMCQARPWAMRFRGKQDIISELRELTFRMDEIGNKTSDTYITPVQVT